MSKKTETNYPQETVDQRDCIPYTQSNRHIAKSINGALLLQQIVYWFGKMGNKPFYKLKEACDSVYYKFGESWEEELGFSRREFDTCIKLFSKKIKGHHPRDPTVLVHYWVDFRRLTYYEINLELYASLKDEFYRKQAQKLQENQQKEMAEKDAAIRKGGNVLYDKKLPSRKGGNVLYVKAESANSVKAEMYTGSYSRLHTVDYTDSVCSSVQENDTHTQVNQTQKEKNLSSQKCKDAFEKRFSNKETSLEIMYDLAVEKVGKGKDIGVAIFLNFITTERAERYPDKTEIKKINDPDGYETYVLQYNRDLSAGFTRGDKLLTKEQWLSQQQPHDKFPQN